jgi:cathepsin L
MTGHSVNLRLFAVFAVVVSVLLLATSVAATRRPKWHELEGYTFERYVKDFTKPYVPDTDVYIKRRTLFENQIAKVRAFNADATQTYKKGINHMSDWTPEEFQRLNGRVPDSWVPQTQAERTYTEKNFAGLTLPVSVDYRTAFPPILGAIKDQGQCGSCWAHSATESMEAHWALATGQLYALSQQQITSCTPNTQNCGGTGGCFGATYELAFDYVVKNGGIAQEWTYPYKSYWGDSGSCSASIFTPSVAVFTGYTSVSRNSDNATAHALAHKGPLAIVVDASQWSDYESGIYTGCDYAKNISIDHGVQLVGYGFDSNLNQSYWLVRNSWSAGWGEEGYIRLLRTEECGTNIDWDTNGAGCPGDNNTITTCGMCGMLYDPVFPNPWTI